MTVERRPLVVGNWKMHKTIEQAEQFIQALLPRVSTADHCDVAICPPFTALQAMVDSVRGSRVDVYAQTMHHEPEGPFTGEVGPGMLTELDVRGTLLGHSERREFYGEIDETLTLKVPAALAAGLVGRRHALAKVYAGWVWLMAAVAFFVLWLAVLTLASGGSFLGEETRQLASASDVALRVLHPSMLRTVRWTTQPVLWIVPFTAATGTYLLSSAVALGVRYPLRWMAGLVLAFLLIVVALEATNTSPISLGPARVVKSIYYGPYGFDTLLTARTESLRTEVFLTTGRYVPVWLGLPHLGQWAAATVGWLLGGLLALWAAASRHRERRRG